MKNNYRLSAEKFILMMTVIVVLATSFKSPPPPQVRYITKYKVVDTTTKFSEDKLKRLIKSLNIKYPHITLAQAKLESGNFTKPIFIEKNNVIGMRKATQRCTTAKKGKGGTFAKYETWEMSVIDFALYQNKYLKGKSESEWLDHLEKNYAMEEDYKEKLKKFYD